MTGAPPPTQPKRLLCFGDSNTWGSATYVLPDGTKRWPEADRWTHLVAQKLSPMWSIDVEGLSGRTFDKPDPDEGGDKSGWTAIGPILETSTPYDLIVIMLGTNDMKLRFSQSAEDIAVSLEAMLEYIQTRHTGHILVMAPVPTSQHAQDDPQFFHAYDLSRQLAPLYQTVAQAKGLFFFDAATAVPEAGIDGVHLERTDHHNLAEKLAHFISEKISIADT